MSRPQKRQLCSNPIKQLEQLVKLHDQIKCVVEFIQDRLYEVPLAFVSSANSNQLLKAVPSSDSYRYSLVPAQAAVQSRPFDITRYMSIDGNVDDVQIDYEGEDAPAPCPRFGGFFTSLPNFNLELSE